MKYFYGTYKTEQEAKQEAKELNEIFSGTTAFAETKGCDVWVCYKNHTI